MSDESSRMSDHPMTKYPTRPLVSTIVCFFIFLSALAARAADLPGTWSGTSNDGDTYTFIFGATGWSMHNEAGDNRQEGTYTFNADADPKQLDLYLADASDNPIIGETALFIYKIEGDTLTLSGNLPGDSVRPADFTQGTHTFVLVNHSPPSDETGEEKEDSDDDKVKVYVNCFAGVLAH